MMITDSIPKGIRITELNSFITNGKTKMVLFPCATSSKMVTFPGVTPKDILLYLDVHLTIYSADTVILHAGVNQK